MTYLRDVVRLDSWSFDSSPTRLSMPVAFRHWTRGPLVNLYGSNPTGIWFVKNRKMLGQYALSMAPTVALKEGQECIRFTLWFDDSAVLSVDVIVLQGVAEEGVLRYTAGDFSLRRQHLSVLANVLEGLRLHLFPLQ